jgi:hypothetical protein
MNGRLRILSLSAVALLFTGCGKSADSFSLLSDGAGFKQNAVYVPRKVDVLWVIDNSGSMASSQNNLANNFQAFINRFQKTNTDFRMAVTTTDTYLAPYYNSPSMARLRPGKDLSNNQYYVMTPTTPDLANVFLTAIKQGTSGSGDERAFSSFKEALSSSLNTDFHRPDAFLSVIIVSDEDDFSHDDYTTGTSGYYFTENYNDPKMFTVQSFVDFLTQYTAVAGAGKNFSVNSISSIDTACVNTLGNGGQKVSTRYFSLVDATGGVKGSLCSDFGNTLDIISNSIISLSSVFHLSREPNPDTIVVYVNGAVVPQGAVDGWTYDAATISVVFNGSSVPAAGADVNITFDPAGVKN